MRDSAIKLGEYVGNKLIEASKTNSIQKQERFLYPASLILTKFGKSLKRIPDELERSFIMRDVNVGVNLAVATSDYKGSKVRVLYQKLLHILDLEEKD